MRPDPTIRSLAVLLTAVLVLVGCSTTPVSQTGAGMIVDTPDNNDNDDDKDEAGEVLSMVPHPSPPDVVGGGDVVSVEIAVSGGELPSVLVSSLRAQGGELVDTAEWVARYGSAGLPILTGPGVKVVAAEYRVDATAQGWQRSDGLQWLAVSNEPVDAVLGRFVAATHPDTVTATVSRTHTDPTAQCVEWVVANWTYTGCDYTDPALVNMIAVSATRQLDTPTLADSGGRFDPFAAVLFDELDAELRTASVTFGQPDPTGATWIVQLVATVDDPDHQLRALTDTLLTGWRAAHGELALFTSPTGATVAANPDGSITYRMAGSW